MISNLLIAATSNHKELHLFILYLSQHLVFGEKNAHFFWKQQSCSVSFVWNFFSHKSFTLSYYECLKNNNVLAFFARQQQRFGSCEERHHSSVERSGDASSAWTGRKSAWQPHVGRNVGIERLHESVSEEHTQMEAESETGNV